mmetsp:Transcript_59825/g.192574  ORF Transcript_59825/g.192574 Transcript_59825/m.192574 type:complete len:217 (+) Transcript_59825:1083-1733(+)
MMAQCQGVRVQLLTRMLLHPPLHTKLMVLMGRPMNPEGSGMSISVDVGPFSATEHASWTLPSPQTRSCFSQQGRTGTCAFGACSTSVASPFSHITVSRCGQWIGARLAITSSLAAQTVKGSFGAWNAVRRCVSSLQLAAARPQAPQFGQMSSSSGRIRAPGMSRWRPTRAWCCGTCRRRCLHASFRQPVALRHWGSPPMEDSLLLVVPMAALSFGM